MKASALVFLSMLLCCVPARAAQEQPPSAAETAAARAKIDPVKGADIQRLLEVIGTQKLMTETLANMEANMRPVLVAAFPAGDYRDKLITLFFERFHQKFNLQQMMDLAAVAYDKYLSDEDIKGLTEFYQTPLGRKTLGVLPKLSSELMAQGMQIGQEAGRQSMAEVLAEHPELAKALQDASSAH